MNYDTLIPIHNETSSLLSRSNDKLNPNHDSTDDMNTNPPPHTFYYHGAVDTTSEETTLADLDNQSQSHHASSQTQCPSLISTTINQFSTMTTTRIFSQMNKNKNNQNYSSERDKDRGNRNLSKNPIVAHSGIILTFLIVSFISLNYHHLSKSQFQSQQQDNYNSQQPLLWESAQQAKIWHSIWGDKVKSKMERIPLLFDDQEASLHLPPPPPLNLNNNNNDAVVTINSKSSLMDKFWFYPRQNNPSSTTSSSSYYASSSISSSSFSSNNKHQANTPRLVVAGKMTVLDGYCNIAQMSLGTREWSLTERLQLSLYNSYSGGEVYSILANHTFVAAASDEESVISNERDKSQSGRELIVVGAFDTTDRNSQVTYCSVGSWDGKMLSKVGEGLCNSELSKGMKITTAALAGPDVYVAGSFNTQVWNGDRHEFVSIYNIAHYNALSQVWLPLPIGQITCSWCTVTVLALAWDSKRGQLHVAGKFNAINGRNIPSGLALYDVKSGHLVAHPGGGLTMFNRTQDGVGTALQLDEEAGVLYVMGAFERISTGEICYGLAAYEINENKWTCLADPLHSVIPSGGGNMLLTPYGLMVAGRTTSASTWQNSSRPYTIALLKATVKTKPTENDSDSAGKDGNDKKKTPTPESSHDFEWSWLPGFEGHDEPLHSLANGFGDFQGHVFIAGDNLVAQWYYQEKTEVVKVPTSTGSSATTVTKTTRVPVTINLSEDKVIGAVMAISQLDPETLTNVERPFIGYSLAAYLIALGALLGMFIALVCNRSLNQAFFSVFLPKETSIQGISLDMLTYSAVKGPHMNDAYHKAMKNRCVQEPHLLQLIDPQEIVLHRIIGEGTFGRVWSAKLHSARVAVKEFVFAQAAVAGRSAQQNEIIEEIIGEAGMMAILRHPNVLQLFGCSLTAQAIWIISELCSLGSLRQVLDDKDRALSLETRLSIALQIAEGMMYLHNQDPPIIHRDLKSHNIFIHETFADISDDTTNSDRSKSLKDLISDNFPYRFDQTDRLGKINSEAIIVAKIGDWGSARATLSGSRTMTRGVGTACWLAPEVIKHARSSKYSDVYSFGIILWELATRDEVYAGLESTQIIASVANDNLRPPIPTECPWSEMMVNCWRENPNDRPSFVMIVKELNQILASIQEDPSMIESVAEMSPYSPSSYQNQIVDV